MQITGGKVTFTRAVSPAQYETKKAEVVLDFVLGEGEDLGDTLNHTANLAQGKALEMVGLKKPADAVAAQVIVSRAALDVKAETVVTRTKADIEKETIAKAGGDGLDVPDTLKRKPGRPPKLAAEEPTKPQISTGAERVNPDDLSDLTGEPEPEAPITDKELLSEITQHNAKIKKPQEIRALVAKVLGKVGQAAEIPQDKRAAFIMELKKLS